MVPWAYLSLTLVFAITPGATTAVVIGNTLAGGRRRGLLASLGAMTANATQATLAMAGVSAMLVRWPQGLVILKIGGCLFLTWIGFKSLRRAFTGAHTPVQDALEADAAAHEPGAAPGPERDTTRHMAVTPRPYQEGFTVNMLNPAITSFYVGAVPNFLQPGSGWQGLTALYAAHIAIAFSCHLFWITLFHQARAMFMRERPRRVLDATFGVLLIALAIRIATR